MEIGKGENLALQFAGRLKGIIGSADENPVSPQ
jgi:hypothetical protein